MVGSIIKISEEQKKHVAYLLSLRGYGSVKVRQDLETLNEDYHASKEERNFSLGLEKKGAKYISVFEDEYPEGMRDLKDRPTMIFYKGNYELLGDGYIRVAIVGTRKMSEYGYRVVQFLIDKNFIGKNIVIVTGLADGVDSAVTKLCLNKGIPVVSIIPGGMELWAKQGKGLLFGEVVKGGLVVAEFPPSKPIVKGMFPMRNRLIAAVSKLVILVESDFKGGGMITLKYAEDLGRKIGIVVGSIFNSKSNGTNGYLYDNLLGKNRGKVHLIRNSEDILNILGLEKKSVTEKEEVGEKYDYIISFLKKNNYQKFSLDDIINCSSISESFLEVSKKTILQDLLELEINGYLEKYFGYYFWKG